MKCNTQHNDIQHNSKTWLSCVSFMLTVTYAEFHIKAPFMLSVIMLDVIMLNVIVLRIVAPTRMNNLSGAPL